MKIISHNHNWLVNYEQRTIEKIWYPLTSKDLIGFLIRIECLPWYNEACPMELSRWEVHQISVLLPLALDGTTLETRCQGYKSWLRPYNFRSMSLNNNQSFLSVVNVNFLDELSCLSVINIVMLNAMFGEWGFRACGSHLTWFENGSQKYRAQNPTGGHRLLLVVV